MRFVLLLALAAFAGCVDPPPPGGGGGAEEPGLPSLAWRTHAAAPTPRTEVTTGAVGDEAWLIGGYALSGGAGPFVEIYDARADAWRAGPPYPIPIHHSAAVVHEGAILVFGGYTTSAFVPTTLAFRLGPGEGAWTPLPALPAARGAHGAALVDGRVYLVGGVGANGALVAKVHVFDLAAGTWSEGADFPVPRDHLGVAALDGIVYAAGGRMQSFGTNQARVHALDPVNGEWSEVEPMPTARGGCAAVAFLGRLVVVGGEGNDGTFEEVEAYDPGSGRWSRLPDLPTPRHGLGLAVLAGRLHVLLGGPEPGFTMSGAVESLGP